MSVNMCQDISKTRLVLIVTGSHVLYLFSWGMVQSFGILYIALLEHYGGSKAETSFVQSIFGGICLVAGPIVGVMLRYLSCRTVTVFGTLLLATGFATSMFAGSLGELYITIGIVSVSYGLQMTFLIIGGVILSCMMSAVVFVQPQTENIEQIGGSNESDNTTEYEKIQTRFYKIKQALSFISPVFVAFISSHGAWYVAYFVPYLYIPAAAIEHGLSIEQAVFIASSVGIGTIVGKVVFGFLGDVKKLDTTLVHIVAIIAFGTLTLAFNFIAGFMASLCVSFSIGLTAGIADGVQTVIIYQIAGVKNFSIALGILYFIQSFSTLAGAPIAGWLADSFGRYDEAFYISAGLCYLSAIMAAYMPYRKSKIAKSNNRKIQSNSSSKTELPVASETINTICNTI